MGRPRSRSAHRRIEVIVQHAWRTMLVAAMACLGCARGEGDARLRPIGPTLAVDGLDVTRYRGADPVLHLRARQLRVFPRRFGAFQVANTQQAVLDGVRCDLFAPRGSPAVPAPPVASLGETALGPGGMPPHVTALSIYDLDCGLVRDGERVSRLTAARGALSARSGELVLREVVLERLPRGPVLRAAVAAWRPASSTLAIRGPYELSDGAAVRRGDGLEVDLELHPADLSAR